MSFSSIKKEPGLIQIPGIPAIPGWTSDGREGSSTTRLDTLDIDLAKDAEKFVNESSTKDLVRWALMAVGGYALLTYLASAFMTVCMVLLPLFYLYLLQSCPKEETFHAKKELKRVLRGHHLAEDHPNKPRGYLKKMLAKATASVTAESAAFSGCEQEMTSYGGAFVVAHVKVSSQQMELYWIGALGRWWYLYSKELQVATKKTD